METQQGSFKTLKKALTSYPILRIPIDNAPFRVECNSSDFANGAILSQFIEGKWHPIAYRSRTLSETEWDYEIYNKELMAITDSLQDWQQYLLGAEHVFEVCSGCKNLLYFRKPQKLNQRQAMWKMELQEFPFQLVHKLGAQMQKPDILMRCADFEKGERDNANIILLKDVFFANTIQVKPIADELVKWILRARNNRDQSVAKALSEKQTGCEESDKGLITWQHRVYVPKDSMLREDLIQPPS